ncbi:tetratricopeptide repeat protein [bacterium]|nr:MAG: tetratricopeptide repeat protein [bacterium]
MKIVTKIFFTVLFVLTVSATTFAQTYEDAVKTFNEGYQFAKDGDNDKAKSKFFEVISISEKVGEQANEIKKKAQDQIPSLQYKIAGAIYKGKDVPGAIVAFTEAASLAEKFGDKNIENRSKGVIPKLHYTMGNSFLKQEKLDQAIESYQSAIALDANYEKAYYQLGLVYKMKDEMEKSLEFFDKAIEIGLASNDKTAAHEAEDAARDMLLVKAVKQTESKRFDSAIELLNKAINYDNESANVYYRLAEAYNKKSITDLAIEYANKALQFEKGGKTDRAKIWYELGYAYKLKGNKSAACEAFEQAAFGQFKTVAEHEMSYELKCKQN